MTPEDEIKQLKERVDKAENKVKELKEMVRNIWNDNILTSIEIEDIIKAIDGEEQKIVGGTE